MEPLSNFGDHGRISSSQMRELRRLIHRLNEEQVEQVVEWLRVRAEERYEDPPEPPAAAAVPAWVPRYPSSGSPGAAVVPEPDPLFEEIVGVSPV